MQTAFRPRRSAQLSSAEALIAAAQRELMRPEVASWATEGAAADVRKAALEAAVFNLNKGLRRDPFHALGHALRGVILMMNEQYLRAEESLARAAVLDPALVMARYNLGCCLADQGRFAEAAEAFRAVVTLEPDNYSAYCNLGSALAESGKPGQAVSALLTALQLNPAHLRSALVLGEAFFRCGQVEAAERTYLEAAMHVPEALKVPLLERLLQLYAASDRLADATAAAQRIVALRGTAADYRTHADLAAASRRQSSGRQSSSKSARRSLICT
ncbi:MAG: tetratricopeptide repeat protein [Candidatus Schekmanbacteria bacterium]|nr:tetratricopeptide repeat protein [Candidatus Schekmanbacteria bacterium]